MMRPYIFWLKALILLIVCLPWMPLQTANAQTVPIKVPQEVLRSVVDPEDLAYSRLELFNKDGFFLGKDAFGDFIGLTIFPNQTEQAASRRAEIAIDYPYEEGQTVRYSWRMNIPEKFASDAPANRWWLLARWNDQANPKIGEDPRMFLGRNPSILLGYQQADGLDTLTFSYGVPDILGTRKFAIRRNEWVKFTVEVTWSSQSSGPGRAKLFVNDSKFPVCEMTGRNMYGRYHSLFRVGMQRHMDIPVQSTLLFGDIKVEKVPHNGK